MDATITNEQRAERMQRIIPIGEPIPDGWRVVTPWFNRTLMIEPIPSEPGCEQHEYCDRPADHKGECLAATV